MIFSKKIITALGILSLYAVQFTFVFIMVVESVQAVGYNPGSLYEWQIRKKNTGTTIKKNFSGLIAPNGGANSGVININVNNKPADSANTEYRTLLKGNDTTKLMFTITDASSTIAGAEYRVEDSSGVELLKNGTLTAEDGVFDEKEELAVSNVNTADWKQSALPYTIYVRARDVAGNWSVETPVKVSVGGPVSSWLFNESKWSTEKGFVVDSSGSNSGTAFGGVSQISAADAESPYLNFDGKDDYVGTSLPFVTTKDISISAWYKTNNFIKNNMALVGGNNGGRFEIYVNKGKPGCRVWDTKERSIYMTDVPGLGKWHQVICTQHYDLYPETRLYVDGVLKAKTSFASVSAGGNWHIGKPGSSSATFYQGKADLVTMYDTALNDEQAENSYNKEKSLFSLSIDEGKNKILGEWLFNEDLWAKDPGQVIDISAFSNNGTAIGGVNTDTVIAQNRSGVFDGVDDFIQTPVDFKTTSDLTISAWYKTTNFSYYRRAVILGGNSAGRFEMVLEAGKPGCRVINTSVKSIYAPKLHLGEWTHVACVQKYGASPKTELYVNGVLAASTPNASISVGGKWFIGKSGIILPASRSYNFKGLIDHPIIVAKALSAEEIAEQYSGMKNDYPVEPKDPNQIAYWKFDEKVWTGKDPDVIDYSGNMNYAIAKKGASSVSGVSKSGFVGKFDGYEDYIATSIPYKTDTAISLSAWVRPIKHYNSPMSIIGNTDGRFELFLEDTKRPGCLIYDTGYKRVVSQTALTDSWHHIVCVQTYGSSPKTSIYVDGVLKGSAPVSSISAGGLWKIGASGSKLSTYFRGHIDEVSIYKKELTSEEIAAMYAKSADNYPPEKVEIPAPSALWNFNETSWTGKVGEVIDSSGNSQHGTAKNGPIPTVAVSDTGNVGKFDGKDDYIATSISYNSNTAITLSAWYKTKERITPRMVIIGGNNGGWFEMFVDKGRPGCRVYDTADKSIASLSLAVDVWHHIVCVQTYGQSPKTLLYVDGLLKRSISAASIPKGGLWKIGASGSTLGKYFDGYIDEPAIYKTELSAEQINELFKIQKENYKNN